jgi:hypothetical protein
MSSFYDKKLFTRISSLKQSCQLTLEFKRFQEQFTAKQSGRALPSPAPSRNQGFPEMALLKHDSIGGVSYSEIRAKNLSLFL